MSSFHVHEELLGQTTVENSQVPTKVLRHVLHAAANDRVEAEHDFDLGCSIVLTAREACDLVDGKIVQLDALMKDEANDNDEDAWKLFDSFTEGIVDIETALLDQLGLFATNHATLKQKTVGDGLQAVMEWHTRRSNLQTQLEKLQTILHKLQGGNATSTTKWQQQRDDGNLLHRLASLIMEEDKTQFDSHDLMIDALTNLMTGLDKLHKQRPPNERISDGISGAWITYAAIVERKSGPDDRKAYLGTEPVWKEVETFAQVIRDLDHTKFEAAYNELSRVLQGGVTPPNKRYFDIVKASSKVVPPFVRRNRILVQHCRDLIKAYNKQENEAKRITNNAQVLKVLKEVLDAVTLVATLQDDSKLWTRETAPVTAVADAMTKAQGSLKTALTSYDATKANGLDTAMGNAATEDKSGMQGLKDKWSLKPTARPDKDTVTKVTVTLAGLGGADEELEVPETTKVSALLWYQNQKKINAHFAGATMTDDDGNDQAVDVAKKLKDLGAGPLTLTLVNGSA